MHYTLSLRTVKHASQPAFVTLWLGQDQLRHITANVPEILRTKRQPNWPVATLANRPANHPSHPVTPVGQGQALRVLAPLAALTHGRYRVNGDYADWLAAPA